VVIENKDSEPLFLQHDAEDTLTYFDPPYFKTEDYYENVGFSKEDHQ
jgi:DNA adenine methylase